MKNRVIYLILGLVFSTLLFGVGMMNIDGVFSSVSSKNPLILDGEGRTLFIEGKSMYFHYHLGLVLILIAYIAAIGILLWFKEKKEEKQK